MTPYKKNTSAHLNPGIGEPWAGQVRAMLLSFNSSKDAEFILDENFGLALPIGSYVKKRNIIFIYL